MANNIPGINRRVQPGVFLQSRTLQRGGFANGGDRILCIMGEGQTEELLVASADGGGRDGVNPDYSGSLNPDGRHFVTSKIGLVAGRTQILVNGAPLRILEEQITADPFDSRFGARVEIATGRIELQRSHLVSFGGDGITSQYWTAGVTNVGNGEPQITSSSLLDTSAPDENWTARVVSVIRDGYGDIIPGQATISLTGSTSGAVTNAAGQPIRWRSDGVFVSNGILNIAFTEGSVPFNVGDRFSISVDSGVLEINDELEARYIAELDVEDPERFLDPNEAFKKHGSPSTSNSLSLGIFLAFLNGASQVVALQAKPPIPRKTSDQLMAPDNLLTNDVEGATGGTAIADTIFPLSDFTAQPDGDTQIAIFALDPSGTEEQLLLSKEAFYNPAFTTLSNTHLGFVLGPTSQAYTVALLPQAEQEGTDGYIITNSPTIINFSSPSVVFSDDRLESGEGDVGKQIEVRSPASLAATYEIIEVGDGYGDNTVARAVRLSGTHAVGLGEPNVDWQIIDPNETSAYFCVTDDVALNDLTVGRGLRILYIDRRDADYFDAGWLNALLALETQDIQMVVPLPSSTISNILQNVRVHVETQSSILNGRWRTMVTGAIQGLTPENLTGQTLAAVEDIGILEGIQGDDPEEILGGNIEDLADYSVTAAFGNSFRVTFMWPDEIVVNINGTNTILSGLYLACCMAGFLIGQGNIAEPATYKNIVGFNILRNKVLRQVQLDNLADAGVTVVQPVAGAGQVLHALTTVQSNAPEEEEITIVAIRDQTVRTLRNTLRPFIGTVQSPNLVGALTSAVSNALSALVSQGLLQTFGAVAVTRDAVEPRQFNVVAQIQPTGPVNWIFVDVTVSL